MSKEIIIYAFELKLRFIFTCLAFTTLLHNCSSKKEIIYLQNIDDYNDSVVTSADNNIQNNDILSIVITSGAIAETAEPYNKVNQVLGNSTGGSQNQNLLAQGYLVSNNLTIKLPIIGEISVANKTLRDLEHAIEKILVEHEHLTDPTVLVTLLNAKFTTLGEIGTGTHYFTENNLTILQAIGMAGDLNIRGQRRDIVIIREVDGVRKVAHVDLTSADLLESSFYFIKPNDVIYVKPNDVRVKSAGFITGPAALIGFATLVVSTIVLITK
ncbi:polysaccharide biosynthesis/export family protein [bacterium]|nr:polysaccharide biosynthesis/export family protein [bacterium]